MWFTILMNILGKIAGNNQAVNKINSAYSIGKDITNGTKGIVKAFKNKEDNK